MRLTADPAKVAVISVDVINGFCTIGPLASPRVANIVDPIVKLFKAVWSRGVRHIVLVQDTHEPDAVEFGSFPPHCVRGTAEAETVDAFKALPFFDQIKVMPKNSIASGHEHRAGRMAGGASTGGYVHRGGRLH